MRWNVSGTRRTGVPALVVHARLEHPRKKQQWHVDDEERSPAEVIGHPGAQCRSQGCGAAHHPAHDAEGA